MFLRKLQILVVLLAITSSNLFSATRPSMVTRLADSKPDTLFVSGALTAVGAYALYRALKVNGATTKKTALNTAKRWGLFIVSAAAGAAAVTLLQNTRDMHAASAAQHITSFGGTCVTNTVHTILTLSTPPAQSDTIISHVINRRQSVSSSSAFERRPTSAPITRFTSPTAEHTAQQPVATTSRTPSPSNVDSTALNAAPRERTRSASPTAEHTAQRPVSTTSRTPSPSNVDPTALNADPQGGARSTTPTAEQAPQQPVYTTSDAADNGSVQPNQ